MLTKFFYRKVRRQSLQNRMGFTRKTSTDPVWKPTFQCSNSIHNQTPQKHVWQKRPFHLWKSAFNPHISTWGKSAVCLQNVQLIVYILLTGCFENVCPTKVFWKMQALCDLSKLGWYSLQIHVSWWSFCTPSWGIKNVLFHLINTRWH